MKWNERIVIDPAVLAGKPVIRGTRLAVDFIVGLLAQGWTEADILRNSWTMIDNKNPMKARFLE